MHPDDVHRHERDARELEEDLEHERALDLAERMSAAGRPPASITVYSTPQGGHRRPYVGHGADGARRSARIDREEAGTLPTGPHQPGHTPTSEERRTGLLESAERWEQQARDLDQAQHAAHARDGDAEPDFEGMAEARAERRAEAYGSDFDPMGPDPGDEGLIR